MSWLEREVPTVMAAVTCQCEAFEGYCKECCCGFSDENGGACMFGGLLGELAARLLMSRWENLSRIIKINYLCYVIRNNESSNNYKRIG